jgi:hypothetical protein
LRVVKEGGVEAGGIALETRDVKTVAETFRIPMLL